MVQVLDLKNKSVHIGTAKCSGSTLKSESSFIRGHTTENVDSVVSTPLVNEASRMNSEFGRIRNAREMNWSRDGDCRKVALVLIHWCIHHMAKEGDDPTGL
jgi:hypothetical protein